MKIKFGFDVIRLLRNEEESESLLISRFKEEIALVQGAGSIFKLPEATTSDTINGRKAFV